MQPPFMCRPSQRQPHQLDKHVTNTYTSIDGSSPTAVLEFSEALQATCLDIQECTCMFQRVQDGGHILTSICEGLRGQVASMKCLFPTLAMAWTPLC